MDLEKNKLRFEIQHLTNPRPLLINLRKDVSRTIVNQHRLGFQNFNIISCLKLHLQAFAPHVQLNQHLNKKTSKFSNNEIKSKRISNNRTTIK